jgi:hypothetical protein
MKTAIKTITNLTREDSLKREKDYVGSHPRLFGVVFSPSPLQLTQLLGVSFFSLCIR